MLFAVYVDVQAQNTAPFGIIGTVAPVPCNVTLTGSTVNLGTFTQTTIRGYGLTIFNDSFYTPPSANIACSAASKVAILFVDNKSGKNLLLNADDITRFGITDGVAGTTSIGTYQMNFVVTNIDDVAPGVYLNTPNNTAVTWFNKIANAAGVVNGFVAPGYMTGFAKSSTATTPDAFTTLSANLNVLVFLGKDYIDSAPAVVAPTGSGTITLVYL